MLSIFKVPFVFFLYLSINSTFEILIILLLSVELNLKSYLLIDGFSIPTFIKRTGLTACQSIIKYSDSKGNMTS